MAGETSGRASAERVIEVILKMESEAWEAARRRQSLAEEVRRKRTQVEDLERENAEMEDEIAVLRARDSAHREEQSRLRDGISVARFQIEEIEERTRRTRERDVHDLKEFERAVNEITDKFRSAPRDYDRGFVTRQLEEERRRERELERELRDAREARDSFNRENGLRAGDPNEELTDCALPGSELYELVETTKNLDRVISDMRSAERLREKESELKSLEESLASASAESRGGSRQRISASSSATSEK